MTQVLILGGRGRVGRQVAADLLTHTDAAVTLSGRQPVAAIATAHQQEIQLDLADAPALQTAIAAHDLVVHCAGPFRQRDGRVLRACIAAGVNYIDVADSPTYVQAALALHPQAQAAGITAVLSTGVFPGISNAMARYAWEALDATDALHLSFGVAGSGGAGVGVLRTTFLELQEPIAACLNGQRQPVPPYSQRQRVEFPAPFGPCRVYWFNTVEALTLPTSLGVPTVTTKFGSWPDLYNHLTWLMARLPGSWWQTPTRIEQLAQISYAMTRLSDPFSGTGLAMAAEAVGQLNGRPTTVRTTFTHPSTTEAVGAGTGLVAQRLLAGWQQPGVWPVEQALDTLTLLEGLHQRQLRVTRQSSL